MPSTWRAPATAALVLAATAAACGGAGTSSRAGGAVDADVQREVQQQLGGAPPGSAAAPAQPATMAEWEALWAQQRAAIVERIEAGGWGVTEDGGRLVGPEGFTIDLSACPTGWSDTEGVDERHVEIGYSVPMSGVLADLVRTAQAIESVLIAHSEAGAFTDRDGTARTARLLARDSAYDPARTVPLVDELIDSERVFAVSITGTPAALQLYDKLDERCIPTFVANGHPAWGDPVHHPWTFGMNLSYSTEAVIWGAFVEDRLAELGGEATVAGLVMDNDSGHTFESAFRAYLDQSPERDAIRYVSQRVAVDAPNVKDAMTTLAADRPDVLVVMGAGNMCALALSEAAENGMKDEVPYKFLPGNCKSPSFVGAEALGGDGATSDGWWVVGGGVKDLISDTYAADPYVMWMREQLAANGHDHTASANFFWGAYFGWGLSQALQIAGELEGGLTRSNFILAVRSMDMTHPMLLPGIGFGMDGNADAYLTEGSDVSQWEAAEQRWVPRGGVLEMSGRSANCAWDGARQRCG